MCGLRLLRVCKILFVIDTVLQLNYIMSPVYR